MSKSKNVLMISLVILLSMISSIRIEQPKVTVDKETVKGYASDCLSGLISAMPPGFCWKKGGDLGTIPTDCPKGYFRSLALCYQQCNPGWSFIAGVCYQGCGAGYRDDGLSCYRSLFDFYFKPAYIPASLTNFAPEIPCPGNMYRFGALCYRDCNLIGMQNCGMGACIAEGASCALKIGEMAIAVVEGVATGINTIVTLGAGAPARTAGKAAAKAALKALSREGLEAAKKAVSHALKGKFKEILIQKAKNKVIASVKDKIKSNAQSTAIMTICESLYKSFQAKQPTSPTADDLAGKVLDTLDIFGAKSLFNSCSNPESDGGVSCAKAVVDGMALVDPTGILTIAAAFIHPVCDVPVNKPAAAAFADFEQDYSAEKKAALEAENASVGKYKELIGDKNNCIVAFDQPFLKGNKIEICAATATGLKNAQNVNFNKKIASFIAGSGADGYFFDEDNYNGNFRAFSRSTVVNDVATIGAKNIITSVWFGKEDIITFRTTVGPLANRLQNSIMLPGRFARFNAGQLRTQASYISFYRPSGRHAECTFSNNKKSELKIKIDIRVNIVKADSWLRDQADNCRII